MMNLLSEIKTLLKEKFEPQILEVLDLSYEHADHNHLSLEQITHIQINIKAEYLDKIGKSLLAKHRIINKELDKFYKMGLHSVCIKLLD